MIYICKKCGKTFDKRQAYSGHQLAHKNHVNDIIVCDICGKECKGNQALNQHKTKVHSELTLGIPNEFNSLRDDLFCKYCGSQCKNRNSLMNHERLCSRNPDAVRPRKIQGYHKGHVAWNKGLTKETDERVRRNGESLRLTYISGLHKDISGKNNPSSRPEVQKKISKTILDKSTKGEWHTSLAKNMHYSYHGIDLHGKWELAYAIYLDSNNIRWNRPTIRFSYIYEDKDKNYTPDFYLIDTDEFVEIKGYKTDKDIAKWSQFPKDKKLSVLMYDDLVTLGIFDIDISAYTH